MARKYYSNIIFCTNPIKGYYRFDDLFQIFPLQIEGQPDFSKAAHFPLVIEYWIEEQEVKKVANQMFEGIAEWVSVSTLQNNTLKLYTNLLSAFTNHRFFVYDTEQAWFMPIDKILNEKIKEDIIGSNWGAKWYHFPGLREKLRIDKFSDIQMELVPPVEHPLYFQNPEFDDHEKPVTFSHRTSLIFKAYTMLTQEEKKFVDASVTLICNGQDLKYSMKSLSFISFISSIETMSSLEFKEKQDQIGFACNSCKLINSSPYTCPACGNPIWGISQQFKEYLKLYVYSGDGFNKVLNKIYGIRSKIVHSGQLLLGDQFVDWDKNDKQNEEFNTLITLMQYSKLSLTNWLLLNAKKKVEQKIKNNPTPEQ